MRDIILASASPRRREIMDKLNVHYRVIVSNVREEMKEDLPVEERIKDLALQKALAVFNEHPEELVIGADTIVEVDGRILGKPHTMTEAREMLKLLSNRTHRVITAVAMISKDHQYVDYDSTEVTFENLSDSEIEKYIQTREPYDKAGAYAIQGWASVFISGINGSYYTVMGFPLHKVYRKLRELGYYLG